MFTHVYATLGHLIATPPRPSGKPVLAIVCPGRPRESHLSRISHTCVLCPGRPQVPRADSKWGPSSLESGISGAEGAVSTSTSTSTIDYTCSPRESPPVASMQVIYMAHELVRLGYHVEVHPHCHHP